uniref:Uncharacterized protein n=1 Tax=Heliothis virescens TaxID=7102 RepID=A0A2A4JPG1_HELVI
MSYKNKPRAARRPRPSGGSYRPAARAWVIAGLGGRAARVLAWDEAKYCGQRVREALRALILAGSQRRGSEAGRPPHQKNREARAQGRAEPATFAKGNANRWRQPGESKSVVSTCTRVSGPAGWGSTAPGPSRVHAPGRTGRVLSGPRCPGDSGAGGVPRGAWDGGRWTDRTVSPWVFGAPADGAGVGRALRPLCGRAPRQGESRNPPDGSPTRNLPVAVRAAYSHSADPPGPPAAATGPRSPSMPNEEIAAVGSTHPCPPPPREFLSSATPGRRPRNVQNIRNVVVSPPRRRRLRCALARSLVVQSRGPLPHAPKAAQRPTSPAPIPSLSTARTDSREATASPSRPLATPTPGVRPRPSPAARPPPPRGVRQDATRPVRPRPPPPPANPAPRPALSAAPSRPRRHLARAPPPPRVASATTGPSDGKLQSLDRASVSPGMARWQGGGLPGTKLAVGVLTRMRARRPGRPPRAARSPAVRAPRSSAPAKRPAVVRSPCVPGRLVTPRVTGGGWSGGVPTGLDTLAGHTGHSSPDHSLDGPGRRVVAGPYARSECRCADTGCRHVARQKSTSVVQRNPFCSCGAHS